MSLKEKIIVIASITTWFILQAQGADKYTDGNRPYEFGFTIDGEQHRHEKKDEKGLIEGEFGFITADGVYHVTVYATDEQGRFKILSMKNIRVKPYPTYTAKQSSTSGQGVRQGHSLNPSSAAAPPQPSVSPPTTTTTTFKPISIEPPARSCSHCSLPTTSTQAPILPPINQLRGNPNQIGTTGNPKFPQGAKSQSAFLNQPQSVFANQSPRQDFSGGPPSQGIAPNFNLPHNNQPGGYTPINQELVPPQNSQSSPQQGFGISQNPPTRLNGLQGNQKSPEIVSSNLPQSFGPSVFPKQELQTPVETPTVQQNYPNGLIGESPNITLGTPLSNRISKQLNSQPINPMGAQPNSLQRGVLNIQESPALPTKPTLISVQMKVVDKNTDINRLGPGENKGLPEGLTKNDMNKLLYTFNYTVGFHGHFEEGYVNGAKQGYYFVTGRNGIRTRVDYVADSKGFRPKISQEVLDLLSDDVPKPETEKEKKYGLKGYEFKWLYYPVEAKGR